MPQNHSNRQNSAPPTIQPSTTPRVFATAPTAPASAPPPEKVTSKPMRGWRTYSVATTVTAAMVIVVALALGWASILRFAHAAVIPGTESADTPKRIAVLPFDNVGDSSDAYFAEGVADAVRGKLTSIPALQVTARTSSVQYRGTAKAPQQIGQELGIDYLVMGTVRWERGGDGAESRVQVSPELVQVSSNAAKWQQPFDAPMTDVFQMQREIAGQVAQALNVALAPKDRARLAQRPTTSIMAYDAYLKGQEVSDGLGASDLQTLTRAIGYYEDAVSLDSNFALAWSQLSRARSIVYLNGTHTAAQALDARVAAECAVALSPNGVTGHLALGSYYLAMRQSGLALREFDLGRRAAPTNADLLEKTARAEETLGRSDAALAHLQQAQALDPRSVGTARALARTLLWLRRYPAALDANNQGLALAPGNLALLENKAMIHLAEGDLPGARASIDSAPASVNRATLAAYLASIYDLAWLLDDKQQRVILTLSPAAFDDDVGAWGLVMAQIYVLRGDSVKKKAYADSAAAAYAQHLVRDPQDGQSRAMRALALGLGGHSAEAVSEAQTTTALLPLSRDAFLGAYTQHQIARMYVAIGEPGKAVDILETLLKMPYFLSTDWLRIDPNFAPLHGNPRFRKLLARS